ncbi:hypothetical protein CAL12_27375 [Bordetella genomosp. 8]|uniref:Inclusion body protein n=1 Tax=Bordetella genomosp. 8 TaxID=1416806 RepID=A0A1W6YSX1_9BORD|nr:hypothetical protein [Bordetella genomosp. 8]ARP84167.1 hypothetical protein CAL12_27375 [Bordetella genomosp. 8]
MANPPTTDCDIQIRILIDENNLQDGSVNGVYIVDNRVASGSMPQGNPGMTTVASLNDKICWRVEPLNPNSTSTFMIQSISDIQAWGYTGVPGVSPDAGDAAYTGIAEGACTALAYTIDIYASLSSGDVMTLSPRPSIVVR